MDYWNDYDVNELIMIKESLVNIVQSLEIKANIFTGVIDDINSSIEGRED